MHYLHVVGLYSLAIEWCVWCMLDCLMRSQIKAAQLVILYVKIILKFVINNYIFFIMVM